jgi:CheY-like chemotaxis protein
MPGGGDLIVGLANMRVASAKTAPHPSLAPGDYVVVRVTDTGCGIEPDKMERIFEPFYTTKKNTGGTGMGLAVVHAIAASCGGAVRAASAPGVGATFTVYLPVVEPAGEEIVAGPAVSRPRARRPLLVDDDRGALAAMARVLRGEGFTVRAADSAEEGLTAYFEDPGGFDLILADQSMPGLSGMEMLGRILGQDPRARAVIVTGHVEPDLEKKARDAGVTGFFLQPMSPRALVDDIRRLLGEGAGMARVLIIDDDDLIRKSLSRCLMDMGHEVMAAGGLAEGRRVARTGVDVIYLDLDAGRDGRRPRANWRYARKPGDHRHHRPGRQLRGASDPGPRSLGLYQKTRLPPQRPGVPDRGPGYRARRGQGAPAPDAGTRDSTPAVASAAPRPGPGPWSLCAARPKARPGCSSWARPGRARNWRPGPFTPTAGAGAAPSWWWTAPT